MEKNKTIKVKVTEEEYDSVKKAAQKQGESISGYVRPRLKEDFAECWVEKKEVQRSLSKIAFLLDKHQIKNNGLAEAVRKECDKLWRKL